MERHGLKFKRVATWHNSTSGTWYWEECQLPEKHRLYEAIGTLCPCVWEVEKRIKKGQQVFIETSEGVQKMVW